MTVDENAATKALRAKQARDFSLHVSLVMRVEGISKAKASVIAYGEGMAGLDRRLGQPQLPLQAVGK